MIVNEPEVTTVDVGTLGIEDLSEEQVQRLQQTSTAPSAWPIDYEVDEATGKITARRRCFHPD